MTVAPLQVVDLEKAQALGLEMNMLKVREKATEMVWVLERVEVCL